jgi:hypothetical protein
MAGADHAAGREDQSCGQTTRRNGTQLDTVGQDPQLEVALAREFAGTRTPHGQRPGFHGAEKGGSAGHMPFISGLMNTL